MKNVACTQACLCTGGEDCYNPLEVASVDPDEFGTRHVAYGKYIEKAQTDIYTVILTVAEKSIGYQCFASIRVCNNIPGFYYNECAI